ncbi:MAG: hypothetical protein H6Q84_939 [Deltaproteobacteria bacterium]|nr:hypothetical protein [Deltaproteobacteria bacterium]
MKRLIAQTVVVALLAILAGMLVRDVLRDRKELERIRKPLPSRTVGPVAGTPASPESPGTPEAVFRKASPSVVTVQVFGGDDRRLVSQGSGVVVEPGTVVTNRHVVESGGEILVNDGGQAHAASVLHADRDYDLCSLRVPALPAPPAETASYRTLRPGQRVYAIGAPKGLERSISSGLVSSIRPYGEYPLIQTDTPVSKGSSGGGLFDTDGRLVGITTFTSIEGQNLNFALVSDLVPQLPSRTADIRTLSPVVPLRSPEQILNKELLDEIREGRQAIAAAETELRRMAEEIDRSTSGLEEMRRSMDGLVASGDGNAYNRLLPRYNELAGKRNEMVTLFRQKRQEYAAMAERQNRLVDRYNQQGRMQ